MIRKAATRKTIALFFLGVFTLETLLPLRSMALTSGPAQPETKQFAAAGTSEMVDLFSGDFKYNIPLLDVDGYPVNLNYASGIGMDDEASWVGLGWNLNVGAINRSIRGLADDANGDTVLTENYMKPKITVGGRVTIRAELAGMSNDFADAGLNGSLSLSVFSDNYNGYGADVGVGLGASLGLAVGGSSTAGLSFGAGVSMNSSTQDGVDLSPSLSLSVKKAVTDVTTTSAGISANLGYNTREGLKSTTLGASFSFSNRLDDNIYDPQNDMVSGGAGYSASYSKMNYNTPAFYPRTELAFKTRSTSYGFDVGGAVYFGYFGGGLVGYKTVREILSPVTINTAYGFMYAERAKRVNNALMDFMREKDNPVVPNLPNLPIPVATPDMFSYTAQGGGGQFRLYRGATGAFSDASVEDRTDIGAISAEYGFGAYFHGGMTFNKQNVTNKTGKWRDKNDFIRYGDYPAMAGPEEEEAYFKIVGEKTWVELDKSPDFLENSPARLALNGKHLTASLAEGDMPLYNTEPGKYKKTGRQTRRTPVLALTAKEAAVAGLDKVIKNHPFNSASDFPLDICNLPANRRYDSIPRNTAYRKADHFSEISVQADNGSRMVYGIPVYNITQEEYTFSADPNLMSAEDRAKNLVQYALDNNGKIVHKHAKTDQYYRKEKQPSYATAYLLSGVLSPDYADLTGDGITDDDPGNAVKFNYSKVSGTYRWRSPFAKPESGPNRGYAQLNRGLLADGSDDKGNIVYGEKELWYLHSIESKTKIAYFITEDRDDALGVSSFHGERSETVKQKRLKEIRLYSKTDMTKPIKTVVFNYDSSLCPLTPNSKYDGGGKLTLKSVYFTYNGSSRGQNHPYTFAYEKNVDYQWLATDRWGTYKTAISNHEDGFDDLRNDEFPYATRSGRADDDAGMWHLSKITLPSGGEIRVDYESDDYAYVQDRRAMQMMRIDGLADVNGEPVSLLHQAAGFKVTLPALPQEARIADPQRRKEWFLRNYLNGSPYLYAKLFVNVSDQVQSADEGHFDYVPGYAEIAAVTYAEGSNTAILYFKRDQIGKVTANPFSFAAWQKMRLEYPMYAYPGYKNRIDDDRPVAAAVGAMGNAIANFSELRMNFNRRAEKKQFASKVNLNKSFMRLACFHKDKHGGGNRVKRIRINDKWDEMVQGGAASTYGQSYNYTITENGQTYSSGVASYEPAIGGDENPMRLPVPYSQEFKWALSNIFYLEEPMGESLFPAPQVGYRRVTVENLDATGSPSDKMGYAVSEFYTAKEFPVTVEQTSAEKVESETKRWYPFFGGDYAHELYMSQGYLIHLNDMHGKPFREASLNQNKEVISSMEYVYSATEEGGKMRLAGYPQTWEFYGRQVELFADLRQQETASTNKIYNLGVDVIPTFWVPFPFPHMPMGKNNDYKLFRSASVLKTIQDYGVLKETIKTVNGSSVKTTFLMMDPNTGEVILSKVQNEFEDPVYTSSIPAYQVHEGMGPAYKTLGMIIPELRTAAVRGEIQGSVRNLLTPGDELVDLVTGKRTWVIRGKGGTWGFSLIDEGGRVVNNYVGSVKVCRSGYRNMLGNVGGTFVSLTPPIGYDFFSGQYTERYKMLDAKAVLYHEAWGKPVDCDLKSCPEGFTLDANGRCYRPAQPGTSNHFVVAGDTHEYYGANGALIRTGLGLESRYFGAYWGTGNNSRLAQTGVWSSLATAATFTWGMEFCVDMNFDDGGWAQGPFYVGFAVDNNAKFYIDGTEFANLSGGGTDNHTTWYVKPLYVSKDKHTFRIEAEDWPTPPGQANMATVAMEIYLPGSETALTSGDIAQIESKRIFTTRNLVNDPNVNVYVLSSLGGTRSSERWRCPNGGSIQPCDGTPHCGSAMPGECPEGYTKSADGQACIPNLIQSSDSRLNVIEAPDDSTYDMHGALLQESGYSDQTLTSSLWGGPGYSDCSVSTFARMNADNVIIKKFCGRLNGAGVRLEGDLINNSVDWTGISYCVDLPYSREYYIGYSASSQVKIYIDDVLWVSDSRSSLEKQWTIKKKYLTNGKHHIRLESRPGAGMTNQPVAGLEIYSGTRQDMLNGTFGVHRSTYQLYGNSPLDYNSYVVSSAGQISMARYSCGQLGNLKSPCEDCQPISNGPVLNPYLRGYLGNWGLWKEYVYLDSRDDNKAFDHSRKDLNVRSSSTYIMKTPFYYQQGYGGYTVNNHTGAIPGWVVSREATLMDRNSQELESKDALGRYTSARFGFRNTLPVAVAANARHREIFYDGFEDYKFFEHCLAMPVCDLGDFDIRKALGANALSRLNATDSHTGKYSLKLNAPIQLNTWQFLGEHQPGIYLSVNNNNEYYRSLTPWLGFWGFAPVNGKKYIFSAWVKDGQPLSTTANISIQFNGQQLSPQRRATVEGWKLVEVQLEIPPGSENPEALNMTITGGSNILIDDIRIFPFDAQIKTYSYDDRTLRLMGELDENNYATYYEYDDEGSLTRVKKETERGIITIKESRAGYKRQNN